VTLGVQQAPQNASPPPPPDLERLAARAGDGDLSAFEGIWRQTRDELARALFHLVGREGLEEALQATYANLLDELRQGARGASLRARAHRSCARACRRVLRRRRAASGSGVSFADPAAEAVRQLHLGLDSLPATGRLVYVFQEILGLSARETAQALDLSPAACGAHLRRARLALLAATPQPLPEAFP
jgi:DNA-directed RNA polymerase specialized sigma24 family protein